MNNMATGSRIERKKYKQKRKKPHQGKIWFKRILISCLLLFFLLVLTGAGLFAHYISSAPELTMQDLQGQVSSELYDREGQLIRKLGGQNRELLNDSDIPANLKEAVLAIEDTRFYRHKGIDPIRILGAALANLRAGDIAQGGSTITQQLVKLSVFSTDFEDQTLKRKAQEAWLSIGLEQKLSKDEILSLYLNKLFYSNNVYGAKTAAKAFFGKDIDQISLSEAALLAGIPQAPSQYDPYKYPDQAKKRRDLVLRVMLDQKIIDQSQYSQAVDQSIESMLKPLSQAGLSQEDLMLDAYIDVVAQEVEDKLHLNIFTDGLKVYTNLDSQVQKHLYETVHNQHGELFPNQDMQTAVSIINVDNGQLYAILGGRNQKVAMGLNRAASLNRSVGSTIKPLSSYGPAIEYLNYSTGQLIVDEAYHYSSGDEIFNYDRAYKGNQTMREALVGSRNIPALKTLQAVGLDQAYSFLQKMDINITNNNQKELVESNAIGGEITPIQLSAAYATIANYGQYHTPYTVSKVITQAGNEHSFEAQGRQAMKDSTAYMLVDMLKGVPKSFATSAQIEQLYHAGKTGTTNYTADQRAQLGLSQDAYATPDAWYVGMSPQFAIASWVGYDNPMEAGHQLSYQDSEIPQKIYREMMTFLSQRVPNTDWQQPESVERSDIEKYSDPLMLPSAYTPAELIASELFIKGTTPKQVSEKYNRLDPPTGFDAEYNEETKQIEAKWDPLTIEGDFELTLNGQVVYTGKDTEFKVDAPAPGNYQLGLRIINGYMSSDTLTLHFELTISSEETSQTTDESPGHSQETSLTGPPNPNESEPNQSYDGQSY